MSIPDPSNPKLRQYDAARTQKHFEQQSQYFTIIQLGSVDDPIDCSFVHWDGFKALLYCEESPTIIQYGIPLDFRAIIFEVEARIEPTYCFLTPAGDQGHPYAPETAPSDNFASSWLMAPSDADEDVVAWCQVLTQLRRIVEQAVDPGIALGKLLAPDYSQGSESPLTFLQVSWKPPHPYTLEWLPVFTADHQHYPTSEEWAGKRQRSSKSDCYRRSLAMYKDMLLSTKAS
ncbi:hypothetical protein DENSPDRAFT_854748 [Dentipellis sp. KUC8613]|nr:hypothetical protein DENSPDRAFT_854748 [Dentipellis sp. KUC8613]